MKAKIIKDTAYPKMYRIMWEDGKLSDMVNHTRAKECLRIYLESIRKK